MKINHSNPRLEKKFDTSAKRILSQLYTNIHEYHFDLEEDVITTYHGNVHFKTWALLVFMTEWEEEEYVTAMQILYKGARDSSSKLPKWRNRAELIKHCRKLVKQKVSWGNANSF